MGRHHHVVSTKKFGNPWIGIPCGTLTWNYYNKASKKPQKLKQNWSFQLNMNTHVKGYALPYCCGIYTAFSKWSPFKRRQVTNITYVISGCIYNTHSISVVFHLQCISWYRKILCICLLFQQYCSSQKLHHVRLFNFAFHRLENAFSSCQP